MRTKTFDFTTHKYKKVIFTIDSDYTELVEAVDLEYTKKGHDLKVKTFLDAEEFRRFMILILRTLLLMLSILSYQKVAQK